MTTEFVDELPPATQKLGGRSVRPPDRIYITFAADLKANPGMWAKWPKQLSTYGSLANSINNQRRGCPESLRQRGFEAKVRAKTLYVRFNPEAAS